MPRAEAVPPSDPPVPSSYREAYATLERIVAELEHGDTDLDRVLPLLDEARAAYRVCQERIAAVAQAMADSAENGAADGEEDGSAVDETADAEPPAAR